MENSFIATDFKVKRMFKEFNKSYFDNSLKEPLFAFRKVKTFVGQYSAKRLNNVLFDNKITFNSNVSFKTEKQFAEVLLHEMIHYYIAFHNYHDNSMHGNIFQLIMNRINQRSEYNITIHASDIEYFKDKANYIHIFAFRYGDRNICIRFNQKNYQYFIDMIKKYFKPIENEIAYIKTHEQIYNVLPIRRTNTKYFSYTVMDNNSFNKLIQLKTNSVLI